jgi:hypothetical protein
MADITFLSLLSMFLVGIYTGRRQRPLSIGFMGQCFLLYFCFYLLAGLFWIAA